MMVNTMTMRFVTTLAADAVLTENTAMATRKPKDRKADRHKHPHVGFNLDQRLLDLLDQEAADSDRSRAMQLISILKDHYRTKGDWPPPDES